MAATVYESDTSSPPTVTDCMETRLDTYVHPHLLSSHGYNHKKLYSGKFGYILQIAWVIGIFETKIWKYASSP